MRNGISSQYVNKIPYLLHHIWLTHPLSPREMILTDLENIINIKMQFANKITMWGYLVKGSWKHIVWTNDKDLIPNSVKILEKFGIEVKSIQDYQTELRLFKPLMHLIDQKLWGIASDALRYNILEIFGGVYADANFEIKRSIEKDLYIYDFFAQDFANHFLAARPAHPIISNAVDEVARNYYDPPNYLTQINIKAIALKTNYYTWFPYVVSFLKLNNQAGNVDIIFPSNSKLLSNNVAKLNEEETMPICLSFRNIFDRFVEELEMLGSSEYLIGSDSYKSTEFSWLHDPSV